MNYRFRSVPILDAAGRPTYYMDDSEQLFFGEHWVLDVGYNNLGELMIEYQVSHLPNPYDYFKGEYQHIFMVYKISKESLESFIKREISHRELFESAIDGVYHVYELYGDYGEAGRINPMMWTLDELELVHNEWLPSKEDVTLESHIKIELSIPSSFISKHQPYE